MRKPEGRGLTVLLLLATGSTAPAASESDGFRWLWVTGSLGAPWMAHQSLTFVPFLVSIQVSSAATDGRMLSLSGSVLGDDLYPTTRSFQADLLYGRRWTRRAGYFSLGAGLGLVKNSKIVRAERASGTEPFPGFFRSVGTMERCREEYGLLDPAGEEVCSRYAVLSSWNLGIPLEAQAVAALPFAGLALSLKGNLNPANPTLALVLSLSAGSLKAWGD